MEWTSSPLSPHLTDQTFDVRIDRYIPAHVKAEKTLQLICIPKDVYLNEWYRPLYPKEMLRVWKTKQ